jgi:hypothetical protein
MEEGPALLFCGEIEESAGEAPALLLTRHLRRRNVFVPTLFAERQFAHTFPRGCEDGIAQGWNEGRDAGLADSRGRRIALDQMHVRLQGRLPHSGYGIGVVVGLVDRAICGRDRAAPSDARPKDSCPFKL